MRRETMHLNIMIIIIIKKKTAYTNVGSLVTNQAQRRCREERGGIQTLFSTYRDTL